MTHGEGSEHRERDADARRIEAARAAFARIDQGASEGQRSEPEKPRGIECPRCGCRHHEVVETRPTRGGIRRRRACRHCGRMTYTIEKVRDGGSPPFRASG